MTNKRLIKIFIFNLTLLNLNAIDVHVFGDSHSSYAFCSKKAPRAEKYTLNIFKQPLNFYIHYLGPKTMHRVGRDKKKIIDFEKYHVVDNSIIVYCFGEIDARCHIFNQVNLGRSEDEVIQTLVNNYINSIIEACNGYKNIIKIICCIMPPADVHDSKIPVAGTIEDRIRYTKKINEILRVNSKTYNYCFLDYYDSYQDQNGLLNKFLSDGRTHMHETNNTIVKGKFFDVISKFFDL